MTDMTYLIIGAIAGIAAGGAMIYLLFYRSLLRNHLAAQIELSEMQVKNNELQAALLEGQAQAYQVRQAALAQQKRLENDLAEARERHAEQESRSASLQDDAARQQKQSQHEATLLRNTIARLEQEQEALQDRFAKQGAEWERERQSLLLQTAQLDEQIRVLQQDKMVVDSRLEQQSETWERERLALHIQMNTLEDNLTLHKARAGQLLPPDGARVVEQVRADASAELNRRQMSWEDERQALLGQIERLQSERQSLQRAAHDAETAPGAEHPVAAQEVQELQRQWERERQERKNLEERLAARERQAEQERGALETEIEQLMERLLRLHRERNG